jgi:hypothetical protein
VYFTLVGSQHFIWDGSVSGRSDYYGNGFSQLNRRVINNDIVVFGPKKHTKIQNNEFSMRKMVLASLSSRTILGRLN